MVKTIASDLHRIEVRLIGSPLKTLNCYVFQSAQRNLLVDTGFNQPTCLDDLREGISELNLDMGRTDLFVTHFHSDHCGLVSQVVSPESRVYMSSTDAVFFMRPSEERQAYWAMLEKVYLREGYPPDELRMSVQQNPARNLGDSGKVDVTCVRDGDIIHVGDRSFECILTPGHTPGHMCLFEKDTHTMVLGDSVLFDITPNITSWDSLPNSLAHYFSSLDRLRTFEVELALPAHRDNKGKTLSERIDELKAHHHERLAEVSCILSEQPGLTCYEVAQRMTWSIRAKNWQEFPAQQKWFAIGEAMAHLDYLVQDHQIICRQQHGVRYYESAGMASVR